MLLPMTDRSHTHLDRNGASKIEIAIDPSLLDFVGTAIARLGYLHPRSIFSVEAGVVVVDGVDLDAAAVRRDVLHALYRERILDQTMPLRQRLIEGLLSR